MPLMFAVLNNGIAALIGMRPTQDAPPSDASAEGISLHEPVCEFFLRQPADAHHTEMTIRQSLETQPAGWLAGFLRAVERDNAVHVFSGCTTANHRAVVELVLWVLYEELIGPAPVLPEIRDIYELLSQMLPQLPEYLRNLMVETVQRTDDDSSRVPRRRSCAAWTGRRAIPC